MKKKSVVAMLLALSMTVGAASMTGCNLIFGDYPNDDQPNVDQPIDPVNPTPDTVAVTGVTLSRSTVELTVGGSVMLTATVAPSNATNKNVGWSSGNTSVATVEDGEVTAVSAGTAVITVTTEDGSKTATCTVTVKAATTEDPDEPIDPIDPPAPEEVAVTGVNISVTVAELEVGGVKALTANVLPSNATNKDIIWSSDNTSVATVDQSGRVTAVAAGTAKITVTTVDGSKTATCNVTVKAAAPQTVHVTGVTLSASSLTLDIDEVSRLTATVTPADATNKKISWSSDDATVATVDSNGNVKAIGAGTANITVTTEDGGLTAVCAVTVNAPAEPDPVYYTVKFYSEGQLVHTEEVEEGHTVSAPSDLEKEGYYLTGWGTSEASGVNFDLTSGVTGNLSLYAKWQIVAEGISYIYAGNECAAFEWEDDSPANAKVEYKLSSATTFMALDSQLIRSSATAGEARVDIVGLKGGASYDFKITTSAGETLVSSNMTVYSYDRSGYAHFSYNDGVGAYNDDGTPKANANIVYVTEDNKNATFTVEGRNFTGIVGLLSGAKNLSNPLIVRVVGTVGAATWNKIDYNADGQYSASNKITADKIVGANGTTQLPTAATTTQATLLAGGYNTLNYNPDDEFYTSRTPVDGKTCDELLGLTSQITYDGSAYDSCWNDCRIPDAKNITVEGIGEDARLFQWGLTFQKCNSIEVRNLKFDDYTEDACSFESSSDSYTSKTDPNGFTYKHFWVHNNTFEEGMNYWDVSDEQDKHDGDGSTDVKRVAYVTFSYNIYNGTHKTGLVGSSDSVYTASVTFHHNFYNNCKARLPLARKANMHMYNNYYYGTSSTDLSLRANAYAFVENCYFEGNNRPIELQYHATYGSGAAKLVGCVINTAKTYIYDGVPATNLGINVDRGATVTNGNEYGTTFDTNSSLFYCKTVDGKTVSDVENMLTAEQTKELVPKLAGVQTHGGDVTLGGTGSGDSGESGGETGGETGGEVIASIVTLNPSDLTPQSPFTGSLDCGVFKLVGGDGFAVTAGSGSFTYNGTEYTTTNYIALGGSANFSSGRYIEFTTTAACRITVAALSGGSDERTLNLVNVDDTSTILATLAAPAKGTTLTGYSCDCDAAGTYRLGSSKSGINVYYIIIEYIG